MADVNINPTEIERVKGQAPYNPYNHTFLGIVKENEYIVHVYSSQFPNFKDCKLLMTVDLRSLQVEPNPKYEVNQDFFPPKDRKTWSEATFDYSPPGNYPARFDSKEFLDFWLQCKFI